MLRFRFDTAYLLLPLDTLASDLARGSYCKWFYFNDFFPLFKPDASGDVNLTPRVVLRERCKSGPVVTEDADRLKRNSGMRFLLIDAAW